MPMPLNILVIGAGSIGLATGLALSQSGHSVHILERRPHADATSGRGSAITLYGNAVRLLERWNVSEFFARRTFNGENTVFRYADGEVLRAFRKPKNGHQSSGIFRADLVEALHDAAVRDGVKIEYGIDVTDVEDREGGPIVSLADGRRLVCDILIGADGIRSLTRRSIFPKNSDDLARLTGDVTFQISAPKAAMYEHPSTRAIYDSTSVRLGVGPNSVLISQPLFSRNHYDAQIVCLGYESPDLSGHWGEHVDDLDLLQSLVKDWSEETRRIFAAADGAWKWRIGEVEKLPRWSTPAGRIVLVGDACHAMVPYAGAGTGQGLEDAAVLAELLDHVSRKDELGPLMKLYYRLRSSRVDKVRVHAHNSGKVFCFPDGPEQEKRDHYLRIGLQKRMEVEPDYVDLFGSTAFHMWLETFDVVEEAREAVLNLDIGQSKQAKL